MLIQVRLTTTQLKLLSEKQAAVLRIIQIHQRRKLLLMVKRKLRGGKYKKAAEPMLECKRQLQTMRMRKRA